MNNATRKSAISFIWSKNINNTHLSLLMMITKKHQISRDLNMKFRTEGKMCNVIFNLGRNTFFQKYKDQMKLSDCIHGRHHKVQHRSKLCHNCGQGC